MSAAEVESKNIALERSQVYSSFVERYSYPESTEETGPNNADYLEAFDQSVSKSASSLYEVSYKTIDRSALNEELIRFYNYFGLKRSTDAEFPDHITVELQFMHFLTFLEAQESSKGRSVEGLRSAQHDFIKRHLSVIAHGLDKDHKTYSNYYSQLVSDLKSYISSELSELAVGHH